MELFFPIRAARPRQCSYRNHQAPEESPWLAVPYHSQLPAIDCSKTRAQKKKVNKHTRTSVWKWSTQKENIRSRTNRNVIYFSNPMAAPEPNSPQTRPHSAPISGFSPQSGLALIPVTLVLSALLARQLPNPWGCPIVPDT